MAKTKNKKNNIIVDYFKPFGVKQICDILMLAGVITTLVGCFTNETVVMIGLIVFLLGNVGMIARNVMILFSGINKKAPEYKDAFANVCVMGVLFAIALFGLIYYFVK